MTYVFQYAEGNMLMVAHQFSYAGQQRWSYPSTLYGASYYQELWLITITILE